MQAKPTAAEPGNGQALEARDTALTIARDSASALSREAHNFLADIEDLVKATQYVPQALAELKAGKPVSVATSQPYGCGVKYGS